MRDKVTSVLKIAIPAVGEMVLYMLVWVIDTAFIGNYGKSVAVSAVSFSSEIMYTVSNIFIASGISIGITTMVAMRTGAQKKNEAEEFLNQGFIVGTIVSFIIAFITCAFPGQILHSAGCNDVIIPAAIRFMRIVSIGLFFNMLCNMLSSGLRGNGNTTIPLITSIIVNIFTIILDYILIFGRLGLKPLGILGSAAATSIAYFIGFAFLIFYYKFYSDIKLKLKYIKNLNKNFIDRIVRLAVPSGMQEGAFSLSRLLTLSFIMQLGVLSFAANSITSTIESVSYMPAWGFAVAATALVGQSIGNEDYKSAKEYAYISVIFGTCMMLLCSILFITIPDKLIYLFIKEKGTISLGRLCLMVASIEQPFMAVSMILGGVLKGCGDTKTPFKISLISSWLIRIPLIYIVIFIFHLNVVYVWFATSLQWVFEGITTFIVFKRKCRTLVQNQQ